MFLILLSFAIFDTFIEYGEFWMNYGPLIWNVPVVAVGTWPIKSGPHVVNAVQVLLLCS
jgi:hypothetical protein